jgi:bacteriorhodopsin
MSKTIFYIKLVHSLLFFLIGICTIYVFIAAALDHITRWTWFAFGVAVIELLALALNEWRCPLTDMAERKGAQVGSVADLFLPQWVSDQLFTIFGVVFFITCLLLVWRLAY